MGERGTVIKRKILERGILGPLLLLFFLPGLLKRKEGEIPGESIRKKCCKLFTALSVFVYDHSQMQLNRQGTVKNSSNTA